MQKLMMVVAAALAVALGLGWIHFRAETADLQETIASLRGEIDELRNGADRRFALAKAAFDREEFSSALEELAALAKSHPDAAQKAEIVALREKTQAAIDRQRKEAAARAEQEKKRAAEEAERARQLELRKGMVAWEKYTSLRTIDADARAGTNIKSIYTELLALAPSPQDRYETDSAFFARVRSHYAGKKLGTFSVNSVFLFVGGHPIYYAESARFTISIQEAESINSSYQPGGSYIGENSFGVKRNVNRMIVEQYELKFRNIERFKTDRSRSFRVDLGHLPMPPDKARESGSNLRTGFLARPAEPYVTTSTSKIDPTVTLPYEQTTTRKTIIVDLLEVLVFDNRTGAILFRVGLKSS